MQPKTLENMPAEISILGDIRMFELTPDDAAEINAIALKDPDVRRRITWMHDKLDEVAIAEGITAIDPASMKQYGVRRGDKLVAYLALSADRQDPPGTYYISYFLDTDERGGGIITKSLASLLMSAATNVGASCFRANIEDDNEKSQNVIKAVGFERTEEVIWDEVLQCHERRWQKDLDE